MSVVQIRLYERVSALIAHQKIPGVVIGVQIFNAACLAKNKEIARVWNRHELSHQKVV